MLYFFIFIVTVVYALDLPNGPDTLDVGGEYEFGSREQCKRYRTNGTRPSRNIRQNEQLLICDLIENYDSFIRPSGNASSNSSTSPVRVKVHFNIARISNVNVALMQYNIGIQLEQSWIDRRLVFYHKKHKFRTPDQIYLSNDQVIWRPDTFFQNEKDGWYHDVDRPNTFTLIQANGNVTKNTRLDLVLSCVMDLHRYPMDQQRCEFEFASYAYTESDIIYEWTPKPLQMYSDESSVLPNFVIVALEKTTCESKTTTGKYSCLRVNIHLRRYLGYYIMHLYGPTTMLVMMSCVSYWIDWRCSAGRAPLTCITLLTVIKTTQAINSQLPPVSYTKAIDVWTGACTIFCFAAVLEYAMVNYFGTIIANRQKLAKLAAEKVVANKSPSVEPSKRCPITITEFSEFCDHTTFRRRFHRWSRRARGTVLSNGSYGNDTQIDATKFVDSPEDDNYGFTPSNVWKRYSDMNLSSVRGARTRLRQNKNTSDHLFNPDASLELPDRIDYMARSVVPIAFCLFNMAYWAVYLTTDERLPPENQQYEKSLIV